MKDYRRYVKVPDGTVERLESLCRHLSHRQKVHVDSAALLARVMAIGLTIMEREAGLEVQSEPCDHHEAESLTPTIRS